MALQATERTTESPLERELADIHREYCALRSKQEALPTSEEIPPLSLSYSCSVQGMELAGFSLAKNINGRGGDLAFPIVFPSPDEIYSFYPREDPHFDALVHPIAQGSSRLGLFLTDPEGHTEESGRVARLVYRATLAIVKEELRQKGNVSSFVPRRLNDTFYNELDPSSPASLLLAGFRRDPLQPHLVRWSYITAGHPLPVTLQSNSQEIERFNPEKASLSFLLGLCPTNMNPDSGTSYENSFKPNKSTLRPGDIVVLYSDGLERLGVDQGAPYFPHQGFNGKNGLLQTLLAHREKPAQDISEAIAEAIAPYQPTDDVTVYVFKNAS